MNNMENNSNFKTESAKIRSLMERMEKPHTHAQALLNEAKMIEEAIAPTRKLKSAEEAFDILDKIGNNKFVSIGYVTGVNMETPIKRKNPATNRMKGYPDWEGLAQATGTEGEISGLVKVTSYNLRYNTTTAISKKYSEYKSSVDDIRMKYGLPPMGNKSYTNTMDYGNGIKGYAGDNTDLQGHTYSDQNTYNCTKKAFYYPIDANGHIIGKFNRNQVLNYIKNSSRSDSGVNALRKMNAEESTIDAYTKDIEALKMNYQRFEYSSILYVAATVDGQKIIYINDKLMRNVEGIDINPQDFIAIAKERYAESLQEIEQEGMSQTEQ
jgi:hypothetical protein